MSAGPTVQRLSRFSLTTTIADELAAFYEKTFDCERLTTRYVAGAAFEALMGVKGGALCITLGLGEQILELLQFDQRGSPYPRKGSAADLIFQHFAIVVSDMAEACRRLSVVEGWTAISRAGPQRLPLSSGGVVAFKFRDPEGHPLEFLCFPKDAEPSNWRIRENSRTFLGIDHSAIGVSDTARSVSFYENLGFEISSQSLNQGVEQEELDGVASARVEVTALAPRWPNPHLELLCYRATSLGGEMWRGNADIATTRLIFEATGCAAPRDVVDPDGHHVIIECQAVRTAQSIG